MICWDARLWSESSIEAIKRVGFAWVGVDFSGHGCGDTIGVWAMFRDLRFRILD